MLAKVIACATLALGFAMGAMAQQAVAERVVARDLNEETQFVGVTVKDLYGREETRQIPVTIFKPSGAGPFPLVVMNHGRAVTEKRAQQGRGRFEQFSRYMVSKGFVVMVPTRVGYADTYGDFDPEASGSCTALRPEAMAQAASDQVLATINFAKTLPYVDTSRWIVAGQSVGGLATLATAWRNPAGLVGGINFAGGTGGNPDQNPGRPCQPNRVESFWGGKARDAVVPLLWLYWENDLYWGADVPRKWHAAWVAGGGKAEFHQLPAIGADGHNAMAIDMDHWVPIAEKFLAGLGFDKPGVIERPLASGFARVDEIDKVPATATQRNGIYKQFLNAKPPRALALGADGALGWATGDWAMGKALGLCQQRRGAPCKLYAVDDDVVWTPAN
jgi:dienelactone hydrolase